MQGNVKEWNGNKKYTKAWDKNGITYNFVINKINNIFEKSRKCKYSYDDCINSVNLM